MIVVGPALAFDAAGPSVGGLSLLSAGCFGTGGGNMPSTKPFALTVLRGHVSSFAQ